MLVTILALLILGGIALCLLKPDERERLGRVALAESKCALQAAMRRSPPGEPFSDFLRERIRWPLVTPLLVALHVVTFARMVLDPGPVSDLRTLIDWGANFAPRTTNAEWWRLAGSTFVHAGLLHLLATTAGLATLGYYVERAVGPIAFAVVYFAAGILASLVSLWTTSALGVSTGASGAVFGIYGLFLASLAWALVERPAMSIPLLTVKRIAAGAAIFFAYNLATDDLNISSELAGMAAGLVAGAVVSRGVIREKPPKLRAACVTATAFLIAVVSAIPLRGVSDVRPEIARVVEFEDRTAAAYDAAMQKVRRRPVTIDTLIHLIEGAIVPELQATRARLEAVRGVPPEQMPLVVAAKEYFQLREESWRRRAKGLTESNMIVVRDAEQTERAALEALRKLRPTS